MKYKRGNKLGLIAQVHRKLVSERRAKVLSEKIVPLVTDGQSLLDVGCGYGLVSKLIGSASPQLLIEGIDITVRDDCLIQVQSYDGVHIPNRDSSYDFVMFVDVLHHIKYPEVLLREGKRVARKAVILKDHVADDIVAHKVLGLLDWLGNTPYDIGNEYNYLNSLQWLEIFRSIGLKPAVRIDRLGLYPFPANIIFDRSLHFIARLEKE